MANFMIGQEMTTKDGKTLTITGIEKRFKKDAEGNNLPNGINYVVNIDGEEKRMTSDKIKSLCGMAINITGEGKKTLLEGASKSDIIAIHQRMQNEFADACNKLAKRFQFSDVMANEFTANVANVLPTLEQFTERWHKVQEERAAKKAEREREKVKERITNKTLKMFESMDAATKAMMFEMLKQAQQASK